MIFCHDYNISKKNADVHINTVAETEAGLSIKGGNVAKKTSIDEYNCLTQKTFLYILGRVLLF